MAADLSDGPVPWPPFAHVPGQTPRHAEGAFDALRADPDTAWRTGCLYLSEGYFWEAHELLEAVWMAAPQASAERRLVQALIQLANAGLKARMGRPRAVARLWALAEAGLVGQRGVVRGVSIPALAGWLEEGRANQGDIGNIMHNCRKVGEICLSPFEI